jgi:hypothetical protein
MASDVAVGMYQLGHWAGVNQDAVARYLVGRQLAQRGFYREASSLLEALALSTLPTARIGREWLRQRAVVACVLQDEGVLEAVKVTVVAADGPFRDSAGGRSEALLRLLERCSPHPR